MDEAHSYIMAAPWIDLQQWKWRPFLRFVLNFSKWESGETRVVLANDIDKICIIKSRPHFQFIAASQLAKLIDSIIIFQLICIFHR